MAHGKRMPRTGRSQPAGDPGRLLRMSTIHTEARAALARDGEWSFDLKGCGAVTRFKALAAFSALVVELQQLRNQRPNDMRTLAGLTDPVSIFVSTEGDVLRIRLDGQPVVPEPALANVLTGD